MITTLYSNYVYARDLENLDFVNVQNELQKVFLTFKKENKFKKKWTSDTHKISDITFTENFLENYKCEFFKKELDKSINEFLNELGFSDNRNYKIVSSWMTLANKGESARVHSHGASDLSGVYYFQTTGDDGCIYFLSPCEMMESSFIFGKLHESVSAKPKIGRFYLFHGGLKHGVEANEKDTDRISVSFNIYFERK